MVAFSSTITTDLNSARHKEEGREEIKEEGGWSSRWSPGLASEGEVNEGVKEEVKRKEELTEHLQEQQQQIQDEKQEQQQQQQHRQREHESKPHRVTRGNKEARRSSLFSSLVPSRWSSVNTEGSSTSSSSPSSSSFSSSSQDLKSLTDSTSTKTDKCLKELTGTIKTDKSMNESTKAKKSTNELKCTKTELRMNENVFTKCYDSTNELKLTKSYESMNELIYTKTKGKMSGLTTTKTEMVSDGCVKKRLNEKTANWSTQYAVSGNADTKFKMFAEKHTTRKGDTSINMPTDEGLMTKEPPDNALLKAKKMEVLRTDNKTKKAQKKGTQDTAEGEKKKTAEEDDSTDCPDGGWGYVVLASAVVNLAIVHHLNVNAGAMYSNLLLSLGASSTTVAWVFNVYYFTMYVSPSFVVPFIHTIGWRRLTFLGTLVTVSGMVLAAFAQSVFTLIVAVSVLQGTGTGIVHIVCFSILPCYFKRYRGKAFAVMQTGGCVGGVVGPQILTYLMEEYDYQGATLIQAGFCLNLLVVGSLYHPVEWHTNNKHIGAPKDQIKNIKNTRNGNNNKQKNTIDIEKDTMNTKKDTNNSQTDDFTIESYTINKQKNAINLQKDTTKGSCLYIDSCQSTFTATNETTHNTKWQVTHKLPTDEKSAAKCIQVNEKTQSNDLHTNCKQQEAADKTYTSNDYTTTFNQLHDKKTSPLQPTHSQNNNNNNKTLTTTTTTTITATAALVIKKVLEFCESVVRQFGILKSPRVLIMATSYTAMGGGYMQFSSLFPFVMKSQGFTQDAVSWCLSTAGLASMVTRLLASSLSDYKWFNMRFAYMAGLAAVALTILGIGVGGNLVWVLVLMGVWGTGVGATVSLNSLLAVNNLGVTQSIKFLSVAGITGAFWLLASGTLHGVITDVTGSYSVSLYILSSTMFVSFFLWFLMPAAIAYENRGCNHISATTKNNNNNNNRKNVKNRNYINGIHKDNYLKQPKQQYRYNEDYLASLESAEEPMFIIFFGV